MAKRPRVKVRFEGNDLAAYDNDTLALHLKPGDVVEVDATTADFLCGRLPADFKRVVSDKATAPSEGEAKQTSSPQDKQQRSGSQK